MIKKDLKKIENELNLKLDEGFDKFQVELTKTIDPDFYTFLRDSEDIISNTLLYRKGFEDLPPWTDDLIYLGDDDDASPYIYNLSTKGIQKLHKGYINKEPIYNFDFVDDAIHFFKSDSEEIYVDYDKRSFGDFILNDHPWIIPVILFFVILPGFGILVSFILDFIKEFFN